MKGTTVTTELKNFEPQEDPEEEEYEEYYDPYNDPDWEPPCRCWCEICGCHGYCYEDDEDEDDEELDTN